MHHYSLKEINMSAYDIMLQRRSVRKFTDQQVTDEQIDTLLKAAMAAPSACNKQPWEFYVIKNADTLKSIKGASLFTKMNSTLIIIVAGNTHRALPKPAQDFWVQDCSAATQNILLAATEMGLGACWCGVHPVKLFAQKVQKILNLPSYIIPMSMIQIGYPDQSPEPRTQYNEKYVHVVE